METGSLSEERCHFSEIIEQIHYFSDPQLLKDDRAFSLLDQELPQILVLCFP